MSKIRKIGILTGGGDCPGLNAVIRAVGKSAFNLGWEVLGVHNGFEGLLRTRLVRKLKPENVRGILNVGGTILGANSRVNPFEVVSGKGTCMTVEDHSDEVMANFKKLGLDAVVVIGGDGTLKIAQQFYEKGMPLVGVPKTIDNDLWATVMTFGYDTAVSTATDAIDKLHPTAASHRRAMVVEVMGRYAGWIALNSGVAGGADVILIPEIPFDIDVVCEKVKSRDKEGAGFSIVVVAEGAKPAGGEMLTKGPKEPGREARLGGVGEWVAKEINARIGKETRSLVLGHLQRGGYPTTFDRLLGTRFGVAAIRLIQNRKFGQMVCLIPPEIKSVPIKDAISKMKFVPVDSDVIAAARALGICFGDGAPKEECV
jgi:6-phosphofructokinase 1